MHQVLVFIERQERGLDLLLLPLSLPPLPTHPEKIEENKVAQADQREVKEEKEVQVQKMLMEGRRLAQLRKILEQERRKLGQKLEDSKVQQVFLLTTLPPRI